MLGVYNYTVVLTYIGMLSGFTGIITVMQGNIHGALICLIISGVCDMFDGKIASTMERTEDEKRFGIQIDSLSDLISFGLLPAVITVTYCSAITMAYAVASTYLLAALIRLAWFNVEEEQRQNTERDERKYYLGLPVTTAAVIVPAAIWATDHNMLIGASFYPTVLMFTAAAFLAPIKIRKLTLPKLGLVIIGAVGTVFLAMSGMDV